MHFFIADAGQWARFLDDGWEIGVIEANAITIGGIQVLGPQESPISGPSGGVVIDAEARSAIAAILSTLRAHGLISV